MSFVVSLDKGESRVTFRISQYLRLAAALGARTSGAAAGVGVTAAAATAAAAAADGAAAPSQLHGMAGNLYPVFIINNDIIIIIIIIKLQVINTLHMV